MTVTTISSTTAPSSVTAAPTTTTAPTTTEAVPEVEPVAGFEERSVTFGNIELLLTGAFVSDEETRSYADGAEPPVVADAGSFLYLDIQATNLTAGTQIALGDAAFSMDLGGQAVAPDSTMSFLSEIPAFIQPNSAVSSFLAFPVEEGANATDAVLVVGERGDRQERLPLTGPVPEPDYPVTIELEGSGEGVGPTNAGTIVYTVLEATLSEDVPHEHATSPTGLRADEEQLFLVVHLRAEMIEGRGPDLLVNGLRLLVDEVPQAPWDVADSATGSTASPAVQEGAASDAWAAFLVPEQAEELFLQVGDPEADPGLILLEITPLP